MLRSVSKLKLLRYPKHTKKALENKIFSFTDKKLNIICGHNGVGKSTLLNLIKKAYGVDRWCSYTKKFEEVPFSIDRDDSQVLIDCDTFYQRKNEHNSEYSYNIQEVASNLLSGTKSSGEHRMECQEFLKTYLESKQWNSFKNNTKPILVFDEPTLSMSPDIERQYFKYMSDWCTLGKIQIIIASNAVTHLDMDFNFIELEKDWIKNQKDFVNKLYNLYKGEHNVG